MDEKIYTIKVTENYIGITDNRGNYLALMRDCPVTIEDLIEKFKKAIMKEKINNVR